MLKILGRDTSANVMKVLWACTELGLDYEREDIGGPFGRNRDPEYLALNPNAVVPTVIEDDEFILWESNSVTRYLAAKHGMGTLCPADLRARASAERWMDWQLSVLGPAIFPLFWGLIRTPEAERNWDSINAGRDATSAAMKIIDWWMADHRFAAGEAFSFGDIPIGIFTYRWFTLDIKREDYPHLRRWYDEIAARDGFVKHIAKPLV